MDKKDKKLSFEDSLSKVEEIVGQLEAGDVPLEKAIELYKQGMEFSKICSDTLNKAEEQIQLLTEIDGQPVIENIESKNDK